MRLIKRLARFTFTTDMLSDFVFKAVTPEDIVRAKQEGRHCLYLTGNGVPLTQQWETTTDEMKFMRIFFQLGIRMMHMTYNRRNMLGDGCAEPANAGLSDFGRTVVAEMNRLGIIPDVAHSGWQTSLETAQVSKKPVVASHSTCASIHKHIRSKPDEVIKAIVETNGLIGCWIMLIMSSRISGSTMSPLVRTCLTLREIIRWKAKKYPARRGHGLPGAVCGLKILSLRHPQCEPVSPGPTGLCLPSDSCNGATLMRTSRKLLAAM